MEGTEQQRSPIFSIASQQWTEWFGHGRAWSGMGAHGRAWLGNGEYGFRAARAWAVVALVFAEPSS